MPLHSSLTFSFPSSKAKLALLSYHRVAFRVPSFLSPLETVGLLAVVKKQTFAIAGTLRLAVKHVHPPRSPCPPRSLAPDPFPLPDPIIYSGGRGRERRNDRVEVHSEELAQCILERLLPFWPLLCAKPEERDEDIDQHSQWAPCTVSERFTIIRCAQEVSDTENVQFHQGSHYSPVRCPHQVPGRRLFQATQGCVHSTQCDCRERGLEV